MPLTNNVLRRYPTARVLAIIAIQAACPTCGALCETASPAHNKGGGLKADNRTIIASVCEMDLAECSKCHGQFRLPDTAFIPQEQEGENIEL